MKDGFLLIDKESDYTSRDVCNIIAKIFDAKNIAFFSKSSDLSLCCCKILRASLACKHAQIHLPIG